MSQFEERQLSRIGVVCPCGTESIFDLNRDQPSTGSTNCPGCGHDLLPPQVVLQRYDYNWISYYKRMRDTSEKAVLRFYFAELA